MSPEQPKDCPYCGRARRFLDLFKEGDQGAVEHASVMDSSHCPGPTFAAPPRYETTTLGERIYARLLGRGAPYDPCAPGEVIGLVYDSTDITGQTVAVAFMGRATEHLSMANAVRLRDGLTEWIETVAETSRERADRIAAEERQRDLERIAAEQKQAAKEAEKERPR